VAAGPRRPIVVLERAMGRAMLLFAAGVGLCVAGGCRTPSPAGGQAARNAELDELAQWMTGSFSSAEQHAVDPENYHDIRLYVVPIWKERTDGPWLYVEQAMAARPEQPYRQRIYHLIARGDGTVENTIHTLPGDPLRYAGAWQEPARFDELTPAQLALRTGCALILRRQADQAFVGTTVGQDCQSNLRGAHHATTETTITPEGLVTWDRGYDAQDRLVWGTATGGYIFRRCPE
jgi:CpeT protein